MAVRIGDDILEVTKEGGHVLTKNGKEAVLLQTLGGYKVDYTMPLTGKKHQDRLRKKSHVFDIHLGNGTSLSIRLHKFRLSASQEAYFHEEKEKGRATRRGTRNGWSPKGSTAQKTTRRCQNDQEGMKKD